MGLSVDVPVDPPPAWAGVLVALRAAGLSPVVKMVDGLPAFPGEEPDETCGEVRLGFPAGMVTLRRVPGGVTCVVWGTAGADLLAARDACAAAVGGGSGGVASS